jgi:hypothetical protein
MATWSGTHWRLHIEFLMLDISTRNLENHFVWVYLVALGQKPRPFRRLSFRAIDGSTFRLPCEGMQAMSRLARHTLVALVVTLYGSVALCGVGLHGLMETGPSHHDHGPCRGEDATISGVSNHCPLCEFQAQGQLPLGASRLEAQPLVLPHLPLLLTLLVTSERHSSCSPRAPPSSLVMVV